MGGVRRCWAVVLVAAVAGGCAQTSASTPPAQERVHRVLYVVDGDTVQLEQLGRARLIGVDAPELRGRECGATAARAFLRRRLEDRQVAVSVGREARDRYGRALVRLRRVDDAHPVSEQLVRGGLARVLTIAPNDEDAPRLEQLQARAQRHARGVWGSCRNNTTERTSHAG